MKYPPIHTWEREIDALWDGDYRVGISSGKFHSIGEVRFYCKDVAVAIVVSRAICNALEERFNRSDKPNLPEPIQEPLF